MKIAIQVMLHPYTNQDVDTAIRLARKAVEKGHEVSIFLFCDSVLAINTSAKPVRGDRNIPKLIEELIGMGVKVHICGICFQYRGLEREKVVKGANLSGLPELASLIYESDRFVNLMA